jgi:hypothetical protein
MDPYTIIKEEHRSFPRNGCPVDLMGEIANEAEGPIAFILNKSALSALMLYRPVKKSIDVYGQDVYVSWKPSGDNMYLCEIDESNMYLVVDSDTEELQYHLPAGEVTAYYIEEEQ